MIDKTIEHMQRKTHLLDKHIGLRLKMRRILMNKTQDDLAKELKITFQQIQKYEKATNRISASRLYEIAKILNTEITYFFEGYRDEKILSECSTSEEVYNFSIHNKEKLSNSDIIAKLINMPSSEEKKDIFDALKKKLLNIA